MKRNNALVFFALFWSSITLLFDGFLFVPAARELIAIRFPTTEGTIQSSSVTSGESDDCTVYGVALDYTYSVAGQNYSSDRYRYDKWKSSDSGWAYRVVAEHPVGMKVPVFYSPAHPEDAVLSTGIKSNDLFMLTFMTPFNFVMAVMWTKFFESYWRRWSGAVAGGIRIIKEPKRIRATLIEWSPLWAGLGMIALLAFLGTFVAAFPYGGHPPMTVMLEIWSGIIFGGITAGVWHQYNIVRGKYDLIIDESASWIELPCSKQRKTRRRIPFKNIEGLRVNVTYTPNGTDEAVKKYEPTLVLRDDNSKTESLCAWAEEEKAHALVDWLRKTLPRQAKSERALAGRF